jgi:hypothetical protein
MPVLDALRVVAAMANPEADSWRHRANSGVNAVMRALGDLERRRGSAS